MTETFQGRGISAGIGIGLASILPDVQIDYPEEKIDPGETEAELEKFEHALDRARQVTGNIRRDTQQTFHEPLSNLFSVQEMILEDPMFIEGVREGITDQRYCAESAVIKTLDRIRSEFSSRTKNTPIQTRKMDILDAGWRVLRHLDTSLFSPRLPQDGIIVTEDMTPSMAVRLERTSVEGLVVKNVDRSSHLAVISQALEIPAVGIMDDEFYDRIEPGQQLIVGANQNRVIVDPDPKTLESHRQARENYFQFTSELEDRTRELEEPDLAMAVRSNLGFLSEVSMVQEHGGLGAGLVRTEFLFMGHSVDYPPEDRQVEIYGRICDSLKPHPVTLRTFDLGGDKTDFESEATLVSELGPQGRGLYRSLQEQEELRKQLRAMLNAHAEYGNIRLLLPMVGSPDEVVQVRRILEELSAELNVPLPPLGVIVEIPSLVYMLDELADVVDFLSLGTNDLMYYLIGADRFAWQARDFVDLPDPALLRCMYTVAESVRDRDLTLAVCGEIAGNPLFTPLIAAMGYDEVSMSPIRIPEVKMVAHKCRDDERLSAFLRRGLKLTDRNELKEWVEDELTGYVEDLFRDLDVGDPRDSIDELSGGLL